ncbi:MAG: UDP-N-acetylmuramate dehydrogenase [Chitinophagales bacterium]|nr:UDP-N-acetylmuramate dehydrogenase [Chitinophagales bacterium]MDW8393037.1 UDP-N-acetylmuramate dehydrogenase [Chitinophagales bacterium]
MTVQENVSLRPFNTFGVEARARYFAVIQHADDLRRLMDHSVWQQQRLVLGGGSNILFAGDFHGLVLHNRLSGFEQLATDEEAVVLRIASGENWHQTVLRCVASAWCGLENLALIPGSVGAAPIQNIGAYGAEFQDCCRTVAFIRLDNGLPEELSVDQCRFAYRDSVFKHELSHIAFITSVTVRLHRRFTPNLRYAALQQYLQAQQISRPTLRQVADAVIAIRRSKLPDPDVLGNAGSFFRNPVLDAETAQRLQQLYPQAPVFARDGAFKVPAAWLIEQCGWKGKRYGQAGVYEHQPLVLVNHGQASGGELLTLARQIRESVYQQFGIRLEPEVNIVGNGQPWPELKEK